MAYNSIYLFVGPFRSQNCETEALAGLVPSGSCEEVLFWAPHWHPMADYHLGILWLVDTPLQFPLYFSHLISSVVFCFSSLLRTLVLRFRVLPTS